MLGPSAGRHFRWDAGTGALAAGDTAAVDPADKASWKMLVQVKAEAEERYVKPIRMKNGVSFYNIFVTPTAMADLKQDPDFLANIRNSMPRSSDNPLFKGAETFYVDGMAIHSYRHVYNTRGAASPNKWGAAGDVDGCRILVCGAQALGFADIGDAEWVEKGFDYENQQGISYGKIMGMLKPKFHSIYENAEEDFGVIALDVAQTSN